MHSTFFYSLSPFFSSPPAGLAIMKALSLANRQHIILLGAPSPSLGLTSEQHVQGTQEHRCKAVGAQPHMPLCPLLLRFQSCSCRCGFYLAPVAIFSASTRVRETRFDCICASTRHSSGIVSVSHTRYKWRYIMQLFISIVVSFCDLLSVFFFVCFINRNSHG